MLYLLLGICEFTAALHEAKILLLELLDCEVELLLKFFCPFFTLLHPLLDILEDMSLLDRIPSLVVCRTELLLQLLIDLS